MPPLDDNDILIGHSTGCLLALRVLEHQHTPIKSCVLVCPFVSDLGNEYDVYNRSFYDKAFDWPSIKKAARAFEIFAGSDDPYVASEHVIEVAAQLGKPIRWIENGGHLNADSGYLEFPALLNTLEVP